METTHQPAPLGGKLVTPVTVTLAAITAVAGIVLLVRFFFGLGAVTNISDGVPWGIWVIYDVMIGSAFACGGYSIAMLVYIFNRGEYHPLVRPALLASLFGYTLAGAAVVIDLGRYWNVWHIFWPGYAQINSVMFEVAVCITAYIFVMWIEFSPAFLEKFGKHDVKRKLNKALFLIVALGVLLPSMHQSSLGSLLVVFGYQIHPLWQAGWLIPLEYLMTAVLLGFAIVIFEATLAARGFRRPMETPMLAKLAGVIYGVLIAYAVVRFGDLIVRGAILDAFRPSVEALMFWIESACFLVPIAILHRRAARSSAAKLFVAAVLVLAGGFLLRIDGYLVGYETGEGWHYFPSVTEILVTVGMIAAEILGYIIFVRMLPILPATSSTR